MSKLKEKNIFSEHKGCLLVDYCNEKALSKNLFKSCKRDFKNEYF